MIPGRHNLTIIQGSTFRKRFQWRVGRGPSNTNPVNIVDMQFRMQIRRTSSVGDELIVELSTENGKITKPSPEEGQFELHLTHEETTNFDFVKGVYDIEVVYPNGDVNRLFEGTVTLKPEVTR